MTWKAVIVIRKDDDVYEVNSIFSNLQDFADKMSAVADGVVKEVKLWPIDYPALQALYQKSAVRKPWRIDCKYCGGSGWREPTGEAHRATGLMECDQCEPLPMRLVRWTPEDGA